jgi:hypothetical protein
MIGRKRMSLPCFYRFAFHKPFETNENLPGCLLKFLVGRDLLDRLRGRGRIIKLRLPKKSRLPLKKGGLRGIIELKSPLISL